MGLTGEIRAIFRLQIFEGVHHTSTEKLRTFSARRYKEAINASGRVVDTRLGC